MGWEKLQPDGRWRAYVSEGGRADRLQANAIRETRREARVAAKARLEAKRAAKALEPHTLTLGAYLTTWLDHLETLPGRSRKGLARERGICKALPAGLSRRRLADLRPLHLQRWLDSCAKDDAPATRRKRYNVTHSALTQAVAWRLLAENPLDVVKPPPVPPSEVTALDEATTAALLAETDGSRYAAAALVAVTTGLRRGELLALRWRDVDLDAATLRVARSADEEAGKPVVFKAPKTGKGRTIGLMAATVAALRRHKATQAAERLAAKRWVEHGLVFPNTHGEPWRPSTFSVGWGRLMAAHKRELRFHDLRHTHATLLLRAGTPVDSVAKRLGHASAMTTIRVYSHVLEDADASAVDRLESGLGVVLAGNGATS
ncbi:MAG TPA: hypothetical protein DCQ64_02515 [Candidatus Rokubacteria bacterium]|nr:hypothetical protein [Candidatus Rokubacteria bacterium]